MHLLQRLRQGLHSVRDHHQMHVIRHQAIPHHRYALQSHRLSRQIEINHPLRVARQNELTTIATLRHVVRYIHDNYPRESSHGGHHT